MEVGLINVVTTCSKKKIYNHHTRDKLDNLLYQTASISTTGQVE